MDTTEVGTAGDFGHNISSDSVMTLHSRVLRLPSQRQQGAKRFERLGAVGVGGSCVFHTGVEDIDVEACLGVR